MSGAKYRFGFQFRGRNYAYNISTKGRGGEVHNVEFNLDALRALEIPIVSTNLFCLSILYTEISQTASSSRPACGGRTLIGISKPEAGNRRDINRMITLNSSTDSI
ncbi:MAG: hypothetical protein IPL67_06620 [Ignavibacteria bacterium]|nr:hypothetical protein [Ignavibacteria bacterium]